MRSLLTSAPVVRILQKTGLKEHARSLYTWYKPRYRELTVGEYTATFSQEHYADLVELDRAEDELPVVDSLLADLNDDDVFYDIGANIGFYSVFAAQHLPRGNVISFEPVPFIAERLKTNLSANDLDAEIHRIALSDTNGSGSMAVPDIHGSARVASEEDETDHRADVSVEQRRGDAIIEKRDLSPPSVLKIDVEGHELRVLQGLEKTLTDSSCRVVYVELHGEERTPDTDHRMQIRELLNETGFGIERVAAESSQTMFRASKRDHE